MKGLKKLAVAVLAIVTAMALAVPAFAENTTYSITINNSATGHTYEAYQIFKGDIAFNAENDDVDGTKAVLSNIVWGSNVSDAGKEHFGDAATKAESLKTSEEADAFAAEISGYLTGDPIVSAQPVGGKYAITGLEAGYYLVIDKAGSLNGVNDSYTEYIVEVVENSTLAPKSDVPELVKKVKDTNDSVANSTTDWQDSADYDLGDAVPFQLTATLADNVSAYETYKVVFHDTLSAGLTYNGDAKVYIDNKEVTDSFTKSYSGTTLTFSCDDVIALGATDSSKVVVEYTAKLNESAVLGSTGNPNEVYLEYSNNPNWTPSGNEDAGDSPTGETPKDKVIVFTYKVVVNKVDENENPLKGAGFTLYKKNASGKYVAIGSELKGESMTTFTWSHIDDGDYKLVETTTPAGYNTMVPIEFTVSAEHDVLSDNPALTKLDGGKLATGEVSTGAISANIENKAGTVLPETGGIGTVMFYVVGGLLVIGAVALLVTRRRSSVEE